MVVFTQYNMSMQLLMLFFCDNLLDLFNVNNYLLRRKLISEKFYLFSFNFCCFFYGF